MSNDLTLEGLQGHQNWKAPKPGVDGNIVGERKKTQHNLRGGITENWRWDGNEWVTEDNFKSTAFSDSLNRVGPSGYSKSLRYPQDHLQNDSDYVMFNFYRYTPPFKKAGQEGKTYFWEKGNDEGWNRRNLAGGKNATDGDADSGLSSGAGTQLPKYNQSALYSRAETLTPVVLYMPEDISSSYKTNWTGKAFSNVARDAMEAASAEGWGKIKGLGAGVNNLMKRSKALVGAQAIRTATQKITGDTLSNDDVFGGISGVILNPNAEMLFGGTEFRNFSLNYKLVPRNEDESRVCQNIIRTFKQAMLPMHSVAGADASVFGTKATDAIGQEQSTRGKWGWYTWDFMGWAGTGRNDNIDNGFIAVPNLCNVAFMSGSGLNPYVPQYKMCAITNVDVNYTPDGAWATYGDGSPVAIQLTVSFQETKLLFSEDVAGGLY